MAAQFISATRWTDLSEKVQEKARLCLVDNLGATLAGTATRISQICSDYAEVTWPGEQATLLLHHKRSSRTGAAFANAAAANGIDADDSARYAWGHAGAQVFPTALAVAESRGLGGARLLTASVIGYEVAHRIGRCWHDDHSTYQACGSWGSPTCAAVAANLMDLTPDQTWHALGIADYHAPNAPMMRDIDHPAMVKHAIPWACLTGITAAELAARGFTGIPSLLGEAKYREWTEDIGRNYLILDGVSWKMKDYACCGWAHAAVVAVRELVDDHHISLNEIARIEVEAFHEAVRLGTRLPSTTEEAQFNLAWPIAAMLVDGEIGPMQTLEHGLCDPRIRELAGKVEVHETEEFNELCRLHAIGDPQGQFASAATIVLTDGRAFRSGAKDSGLRFPPPNWTRERMSAKFRWLTAHVLDTTAIEEILEMAWHLDELDDVRELTRRLT